MDSYDQTMVLPILQLAQVPKLVVAQVVGVRVVDSCKVLGWRSYQMNYHPAAVLELGGVAKQPAGSAGIHSAEKLTDDSVAQTAAAGRRTAES